MKIARKPNGQLIQASVDAPRQATCPNCGGLVMLRQRKRMNQGGVAYFWRHKSNQNRHCAHRAHPAT